MIGPNKVPRPPTATQIKISVATRKPRNGGDTKPMNPRTSNYGRGLGDYFGYRDLLEGWVAAGDCEGLELRVGDAPAFEATWGEEDGGRDFRRVCS